MKFAIRVDDVGWTAEPAGTPPEKKPDVGLRLASRFHAALGGLPWLAGVIPSCLDAVGAAWLRENSDLVTPAIHGWNHQMSYGERSEFYGLSKQQCLTILKQSVERVGPTEHFIPPFNATTAEMLWACSVFGLKFLLGSITDSPYPVMHRRDEKMAFIPAWKVTYNATRRRMAEGIGSLIEEVPRILEQPGMAVITLHVPWEAADGDGFFGVRELAGIIRHNVVSPNEYVKG